MEAKTINNLSLIEAVGFHYVDFTTLCRESTFILLVFVLLFFNRLLIISLVISLIIKLSK